MGILGNYTNNVGHDLEEDYDELIGATVFQCLLCKAAGVYGEDWLGGIAPEILSENCSVKMKQTNINTAFDNSKFQATKD